MKNAGAAKKGQWDLLPRGGGARAVEAMGLRGRAPTRQKLQVESLGFDTRSSVSDSTYETLSLSILHTLTTHARQFLNKRTHVTSPQVSESAPQVESNLEQLFEPRT